MQITFKELTLKNYKSHRGLTVNFGEVTKISGDNAKGKSSIIESACWLLYGTDAFSSKVDPSPVTYEADETSVSLLFNEGEKDILLTRSLIKGKAEYAINDTPKKATDFNNLVAEYFEKTMFLSLFNPLYFFSLKWNEQRALLLQYVPAPINKEVLAALSKPEAEALDPLLKKKPLEDIEAEHKKNKTKQEKAYIAAQSATRTLQKQLDEVEHALELDELKESEKELLEKLESFNVKERKVTATNEKRRNKEIALEMEREDLERQRADYMKLYEQEVNDKCPTCNQSLDEKTVLVAKENRESDLARKREAFKVQQEKVKALRAELEQIEPVDSAELTNERQELYSSLNELKELIYKAEAYKKIEKRIEEAFDHEQSTHVSLKESVFILDAVKSFKAKEAELQGEKVQALFTTLSVRLFENQKNGEIKPTFVIQMDGKDFNKLSLSESIRAGLELREVLSEQAEIIAPCFVDNAESITSFKGPTGQLIMSTVVAGQELEVKAE